ncbi:MAG: hypothetical protein WBN32_01625, partial [Woeseia sp.]
LTGFLFGGSPPDWVLCCREDGRLTRCVSATRNIADAKEKTISNETRLDAAYRAITQMRMAA